MRSFISHRRAVSFGVDVGTSSIAQPRCISSFHRLTHTHALGGGSSSISRGFPIEHGVRRNYGTTAILLKQHQPTNTGASAASSRASGQASRKQTRQKEAADYGTAGALVEPALDNVTAAASLPLAASSSEAVLSTGTGTTSSVSRNVSGQGAACSAKAVRRGRRRQEAAAVSAARRSSTPSSNLVPSSPSFPSHERPSDAVATLPPLEPPMSSLVAGEDGIVVTASSSQGKKRGKRGSTGSPSPSDPAGSAVGGLGSTGAVAANTADTAAPTPSSLFGSPQPVYYTHNMMDTTPRTEEQRVAERCSITKLIMVSGSVSFLFTTLPRSEGPLKMYVKDLNRAQAPSYDSVRTLGKHVAHNQYNASKSTENERGVGVNSAAGTPTLLALSEKQFLELRQRLCAEQLATNTVFIHVREMEQLVPPHHLQLPPLTTVETSESGDAQSAASSGEAAACNQREGKTRGRRGRRRGSVRPVRPLSTPVAASTPHTAPLPTLSPVERLLALQAWKKEAARRAEETQARYPVPAHYHAITRVRFHDPHQTDLTVAMGSGWSKSIDSVLRAIVRSMPQDKRGAESGSSGSDSDAKWLTAEAEEDDSDDTSPPFPMPDPSMYSSEVSMHVANDAPEAEELRFLTSPYTVKPLLTVCASCLPRREAWIGTCAPGPSIAPATDVESGWSPYLLRAVPTVPRYSTRITIMLEHDEMDPSDLVSLAEISTARKSSPPSGAELHPSPDRQQDVTICGGGVDSTGQKVGAPKGSSLMPDGADFTVPKKPLHLYCLVQDAGEY